MFMATRDPTLTELASHRDRFLELVAQVRPELHRFCARMTGSIAEGEDVVQDTLMRAFFELAELDGMPALRPWLFRIAQNRAIDHMRRYDRRMSEPLDGGNDLASDASLDADDMLARDEAVRAAVSRFTELVPVQRSCVVLKDVLGHSLEEIAELLNLSVPAVKAALHRGRARLVQLRQAAADAPARLREGSPTIARYAALFNARDWDAVRAMLAEDVRLDVVAREQRQGRAKVSHYFGNYARIPGWRVTPGWLDGREVLAAYRDQGDAEPSYFIELQVADGQIVAIRDFRHVPYIGRDARFELSR
jgi:RNA polymerase sigma-70 factor (ECF subfamily)